jgi:broad specificity phosphatase PhoE
MTAYQNMKIHILRHGERSSGYGDVSLSQEGHLQAQALAQNPALQEAQRVFCSPKIRTRETIQPLCNRLQLVPEVVPDLDQRKSIETEQEFIRRVLSCLDTLVEQHFPQTLILCSHSDWLQAAVMNLPVPPGKAAAQSFFGCAEFRTLLYGNKQWDLL